MTEEEKLVEEYLDKRYLKDMGVRNPCKEAFLAGLKAGKDTNVSTKWHKVADDDLPNTEREVLVFMWDSYYLGYYKQYDSEDRSWHFEDFDEESEQVIAWCEIPKYTDKE